MQTDRDTRAQNLAAVARARRTPAALFDDLNWDYATVERLNPDLSTQVIAFNLGRAILERSDADNLALKPGDVVTIYSQKDIRGPVAKQTRLVSLEGEVNAPGVYQLQPGDTLKSLIERAGGFTVAGLCLRPRIQPRGNASAPARKPVCRDRPARGAVGHADRARRRQSARRCERADDGGGQQRRRRRRNSPGCRDCSRTAASRSS